MDVVLRLPVVALILPAEGGPGGRVDGPEPSRVAERKNRRRGGDANVLEHVQFLDGLDGGYLVVVGDHGDGPSAIALYLLQRVLQQRTLRVRSIPTTTRISRER